MQMEGTTNKVETSRAERNQEAIIKALYKALANDEMENVAKYLASDLEYWFHGPPKCQHMVRLLTGESSKATFKFEPRSVEVVGDCVIAEGWEGAPAYWVHVWTVSVKDGLITQFREYFNTWLTVKDLRPPRWEIRVRHERNTLWQSQPRDLARRSLPSLLLTI